MSDDFFNSFKKPEPKHEHKIKVVHFKKEPYDIYIGRLPNGFKLIQDLFIEWF
jgi:hypothetical protein